METITINEIADEALKISRARADKMQCEYPENIEGVLKHCAGEVVEAAKEAALGNFDAFGAELADVIMCALIAGRVAGVDFNRAVMLCLEKNRQRAGLKG